MLVEQQQPHSDFKCHEQQPKQHWIQPDNGQGDILIEWNQRSAGLINIGLWIRKCKWTIDPDRHDKEKDS